MLKKVNKIYLEATSWGRQTQTRSLPSLSVKVKYLLGKYRHWDLGNTDSGIAVVNCPTSRRWSLYCHLDICIYHFQIQVTENIVQRCARIAVNCFHYKLTFLSVSSHSVEVKRHKIWSVGKKILKFSEWLWKHWKKVGIFMRHSNNLAKTSSLSRIGPIWQNYKMFQ